MNHLLAQGPDAAVPRSRNDCWNSIGIHGDISCAKLDTFSHCRNCPTYSMAAANFLDRDVPEDYRSEWTAYFLQDKVSELQETASAIIFRVGTEWFALSTLALDEIAECRKMHTLPHRRNGNIAGIVNIRGELLICLSLQKTLGLETPSEQAAKQGDNTRARLLVIKHDNKRAVLRVDEVAGTHRYQTHELLTPPATLTKAATSFTKKALRWRGTTISFLDAPLILSTLNGGAA